MSIQVFGAFERTENGYEGFCWCPDRAQQRMVVDIVHNGVVVASVAASRFNSSLRDQHVGDGKVAFRISDKLLPPLSGIVEARERTTQKTLGRHIIADQVDSTTLDLLEKSFLEMERFLCETEESLELEKKDAALSQKRVARMKSLGGRLVVDPSSLTRRSRNPSLAPVNTLPEFSVIILVGRDIGKLRKVIARSPEAVRSHSIELILVDLRGSTVLAKLCEEISGIALVSYTGASQTLARVNHAAQISCGASLAFIESDAVEFDADSYMMAIDDGAKIGEDGARALIASGYRVPHEREAFGTGGLRSLFSRKLFLRAGGFNPDLENQMGIAEADLALRILNAKSSGNL
jgi:hypothetical protein